jgi:hypothetical protein
MWNEQLQALYLYYLLSGYRLMAAISTEARVVSEILRPINLKYRTPLLSLHVNTLPLTLGTVKKKGNDYLRTVPSGR